MHISVKLELVYIYAEFIFAFGLAKLFFFFIFCHKGKNMKIWENLFSNNLSTIGDCKGVASARLSDINLSLAEAQLPLPHYYLSANQV